MEIGRQFGDRTLDKYARAAAADARRQLADGRYLRAAYSAALHVALTGKTAWSAEDQAKMSAALREEAQLRLEAGDYPTAALRAAYDRMLTSEQPWSPEVFFRLRQAAQPGAVLAGTGRRIFVAAEAADYLLLGGAPFWTPEELDQMLASVREDFNLHARKGDDVMAADRLAVFKLLLDSAS